MKFFFDVCFSPRLCAATRCIDGHRYHFDHHLDHFAMDTTDVVWLQAVGSWVDRPIVISGDTRILSRRDEMRALMEQELMFVCLYEGFTDQTIAESTWKFFRAWPRICHEVARARQPSVFKVAPNAQKVELVCATSKLCK